MKITSKKKASGRRLPLLFAGIIILAAAGAYYVWTKNSTHNEESTNQPEIVESEGNSFPIPEDVSRESITNYELETENEQYKIRYDKENGYYLVTLYAIINNPSQYDSYVAQLKEYKTNALQYLKDNNVDITNSEIRYEPEEATDL